MVIEYFLLAFLVIREVMHYIEKKDLIKKQNDLLDRLMAKSLEDYKVATEEPEPTKEDEPSFHTEVADIEDIDEVQ